MALVPVLTEKPQQQEVNQGILGGAINHLHTGYADVINSLELTSNAVSLLCRRGVARCNLARAVLW